MSTLPKCGKAPCGTCPYRKDVPAGVWDASEYAKLPAYDGDTGEQAMKGALALFYCHQQDGNLCAGWVGTHDTEHLLAMRFTPVDPMVHSYESPVELFASGQEACEHGMSGVADPDEDARFAIQKLEQKRSQRG